MVRVTGLEPARGCHQNLNLARLPIPPHPHINIIKLSLNGLVEERALWEGHLWYPKLFACYSLRTILTTTPFRPYCIRHRRRAGSMLPIPPHPHIKCKMKNAKWKIIGEASLPNNNNLWNCSITAIKMQVVLWCIIEESGGFFVGLL